MFKVGTWFITSAQRGSHITSSGLSTRMHWDDKRNGQRTTAGGSGSTRA